MALPLRNDLPRPWVNHPHARLYRNRGQEPPTACEGRVFFVTPIKFPGLNGAPLLHQCRECGALLIVHPRRVLAEWRPDAGALDGLTEEELYPYRRA